MTEDQVEWYVGMLDQQASGGEEAAEVVDPTYEEWDRQQDEAERGASSGWREVDLKNEV